METDLGNPEEYDTIFESPDEWLLENKMKMDMASSLEDHAYLVKTRLKTLSVSKTTRKMK